MIVVIIKKNLQALYISWYHLKKMNLKIIFIE